MAQHCCGIREAFCQCLGDSFFGKQGEFSFWRKSCSTWGPHIVTLAKITITSNVPIVKINFHINQVLQLLYVQNPNFSVPKRRFRTYFSRFFVPHLWRFCSQDVPCSIALLGHQRWIRSAKHSAQPSNQHPRSYQKVQSENDSPNFRRPLDDGKTASLYYSL